MYRFQVRQLVVIRIYAGAEEQACVAPVDDLIVTELNEVGLVFLVSGRDKAVDLFFSVSYRDSIEGEGIGRREVARIASEGGQERREVHCRKGRGLEWVMYGMAPHTSPFNLIFSSSLYGAYHFASRVFPLCVISCQPISLSTPITTAPSIFAPPLPFPPSGQSFQALLPTLPVSTVPIPAKANPPVMELKQGYSLPILDQYKAQHHLNKLPRTQREISTTVSQF